MTYQQPQSIARQEFLTCLRRLTQEENLTPDYILASAAAGDRFLSAPCVAEVYYSTDSLVVQQCYSRELAHVLVVLVSKVHDDHRYAMHQALTATGNRHVLKLEYVVALTCAWYVPFSSLMSTTEFALASRGGASSSAPFFYCLAEDVARASLFAVTPPTLVVAVLLLSRRRRLHATLGVQEDRCEHYLALVAEYVREQGK